MAEFYYHAGPMAISQDLVTFLDIFETSRHEIVVMKVL